jgi:hypothetical protein
MTGTGGINTLATVIVCPTTKEFGMLSRQPRIDFSIRHANRATVAAAIFSNLFLQSDF